MIKWKQEAAAMPAWGMDFGNPDFVYLAESFGAKGYRVTQKEDFARILASALTETGVKIIDLPFDYPEVIS